MLSEVEIEDIFLKCGYSKTAYLQFRAVFSNDEVHHYVELEYSVRDPNYMPGRVRIGNKTIAAVCEEIWYLYRNKPLKKPLNDPDFDIISQIFLNIDREYKYTSAGALIIHEPRNISSFLNELVTPLLRPIDSLEALYNITLHGENTPFRWFGGVPGARATQALILARKLGITFVEVVSELEKRRSIIQEWSATRDADALFEFVWNNIDERKLL